MADHTTRVSVLTPEGERFYISRKTAEFLVGEPGKPGRAKWIGPARIQLLGEAREWRALMSGGYAAMQLAKLRDRRQ